MSEISTTQQQKIQKLIREGMSQREVSAKFGITRYQVRVISSQIKLSHQQEAHAEKKQDQLEEHRDDIVEWSAESKLSSFLIVRRLKEKGCIVSASTVKRFLKKIKREVYVPVHTSPGEQAQVDFGFLGSFNKDGRQVKVWVFCMVLSHSRYAYYSIVTAQSWSQFMECHKKAFEFFGGVPKSILIDNLRAAVKEADNYQPFIQTQYSDFLDHYTTSVLTARICRGQDKGKVEAGIKYVKNNFLKNCQHRDFYQLEADLKKWNKQECNLRIHGTTRQVPQEVFINDEKNKLIPLPKHPFRITIREERVVNQSGHIFYEYNFYSVPHHYAGDKLIVENDGKNLRIYKGRKPITMHQLSSLKGQHFTEETHKPLYKQVKAVQFYQEEVNKIGGHATRLLELMMVEKPYHWKKMIKGVIRLTDAYPNYLVNVACEKALADAKHNYQHVGLILAKKLYTTQSRATQHPKGVGGFYHDLEIYDKLAASCRGIE